MRKRKSPVVLLLVLLLAGAGAVACFMLDKGRVEFVDGPYPDVTVEFGERVPLHSISAVYKSTVFHRAGVPLEVEADTLPPRTAPGEYTLRYSASYRDAAAEGSYVVRIVDTKPPVLTVNDKEGTYTCWDEVDGDLADAVQFSIDGDYITLSIADSSDNTAELTVVRDVTPPVLTLGDGLLDFTCLDGVDGDITDRVQYYESHGYMYYEVEDSGGNCAEASRKIEKGQRVVYLTFDDGPGEYTEQLLDLLKQYNVRVTFFVVGTSEYLDLLPRMAAEGHSIGAHAYRHNYKRVYASDEAYFEDLALVQQEIAARIGTETKLIRFPGGSSNTISRTYNVGIMRRLTREVGERGYTYFDWNVSSGDAGAVTTTAAVVRNVKNGILGQRVAVVLQHDVKPFSVAGVEEIIQWGLEQGVVFLPLTEKSTAPHHGINN
ncbi:MAG: polysaccharide deacetylase [Oscillospiraceae bacterium]|nr:polysaccharide deacetylase [Oscillospiraceae bacterium]